MHFSRKLLSSPKLFRSGLGPSQAVERYFRWPEQLRLRPMNIHQAAHSGADRSQLKRSFSKNIMHHAPTKPETSVHGWWVRAGLTKRQ